MTVQWPSLKIYTLRSPCSGGRISCSRNVLSLILLTKTKPKRRAFIQQLESPIMTLTLRNLLDNWWCAFCNTHLRVNSKMRQSQVNWGAFNLRRIETPVLQASRPSLRGSTCTQRRLMTIQPLKGNSNLNYILTLGSRLHRPASYCSIGRQSLFVMKSTRTA